MDVSGLEGLVGIVLTALDSEGEVDEAGVRHLVNFSAEKGLDGVVILGSNSEFPYLGFEQKKKVMRAAVEGSSGRIPVISTASAWSTDEAVALARESKAAGCDAVMAAMPFYFRLELPRVIKHFQAIAAEGLPVFFYHFPDVTGLVLTPEELAEIAKIDNIIGAKLTVTNRGYLKKAIQATGPHGWKVFTGTSFLLYDCLEFGGAGVFCPLPLIAPGELTEMYKAFKAGHKAKAGELQKKVRLAIPLFSGITASPRLLAAGFALLSRLPYRPGKRTRGTHHLIKEALRLQGHPITNGVRRPFEEASEAESGLVGRTLESLGWM